MGTYKLMLYAYCGMSFTLATGSLDECRMRAARKIRYHRNTMEYPVLTMRRGHKWELETGDDAWMIGDGEGIMNIVRTKR